MYEQMAYLCKNLADISDRFCFITTLFDLTYVIQWLIILMRNKLARDDTGLLMRE